MNVLVLCRYSRLGASSRLRLYQYIPFWERADIHCDVHPLLDDRYLTALYGGRRPGKGHLLQRYLGMTRRVAGAGRYDLVVIEKEVLPFLPPLAERWLALRKIPYVVDYDDAIFHNYDLHPSRWVRALLGNKIGKVMRLSTLVVAGNDYLGDYARRAGAASVTLIPTVIDTAKYRPAVAGKKTGPLRIVWIGSPVSVKYVLGLRDVLAEILGRHDVILRLIGGGQGLGLDREEVLPWSEATEAELIAASDIGIMPLEDSPWERGKCGYKLVQYMGCGLPVVGSPIGINDLLIEEGVNGFKPRSARAWAEALERLIGDEGLRRDMGSRGRALVLDRYSVEKAAEAWVTELKRF